MAAEIEIFQHRKYPGALIARQDAWTTVPGAPPIGEVQTSEQGWYASRAFHWLFGVGVAVSFALYGGYVAYHEATTTFETRNDGVNQQPVNRAEFIPPNIPNLASPTAPSGG